jgi:Ca2+-binding EF-hand superfamily protein
MTKTNPPRAKRTEKHSETLEIRMPHTLKTEFMDACKERGLTASEVVRDFVGTYPVKRRRNFIPQISLPDKMELPMNLLAVPVLALGLAASSVTLNTAAVASHDNDAESFAEMDRDNDGYLVMDDLFVVAGLNADGSMGEAMRSDILESVEVSLAENGLTMIDGATADEFVAEIIEEAMESANESVREVFAEIDTDADARISYAEFEESNRDSDHHGDHDDD